VGTVVLDQGSSSGSDCSNRHRCLVKCSIANEDVFMLVCLHHHLPSLFESDGSSVVERRTTTLLTHSTAPIRSTSPLSYYPHPSHCRRHPPSKGTVCRHNRVLL